MYLHVHLSMCIYKKEKSMHLNLSIVHFLYMQIFKVHFNSVLGIHAFSYMVVTVLFTSFPHFGKLGPFTGLKTNFTSIELLKRFLAAAGKIMHLL